MDLTQEQFAATTLRGRTVLVSAAAGAGKTRVLVERLMAYVTDTERPRHIDEFLVVTYTRAAAGELRGRIMARLRELSDADPENEHLRAQMTRVYTARIGTLDAYCREILLENALEAGLPSGYRVGDEAEMELLRAQVLEEVLDGLYERAEANPDDPFRLCADTYGDERGDRTLAGLILHIWQKTRCHADPIAWLRRMTEGFPGDEWRRILFDQALSILAAFRQDYAQMAPSVDGPYGITLRQDLSDMERLKAVLDDGDWDEAASFLEDFRFETLRRAAKGEENEAFKTLRDKWKKSLNEKIKPLIYGTAGSHRRDAAALSPLLLGLYDAVRAFDNALTDEKLRLAVLEFADAQRKALALLTPDGERGEPAERISARFCEILVDEYQDINPLQDAIITALSREGSNIFYVGDARQSIYRFQMAEPSIFWGKYNGFPDYRDAPAGGPCRIDLTKNFRSAKPILDAVNHVFSRVECPEMGILREPQFLLSGRDGGADAPVELLSAEDVTEAGRVARRLWELVAGGEARPGDCVILMRSPKSRLPEYKAALEREGLSCAAAAEEGYMTRPEIQTVLSALEAIDNARLDIPLIAVLRSQMAGLSPDDLAALRALAEGPICECLPLSQEERVVRFCEALGHWRALAADLPPYALAARVMADTELPQKVGPAARENLLLLPEILRAYTGELRGLSDWIAQEKFTVPRRESVNGLQESAYGAGAGAVRIMSIHGAKGLEFPVVVVAGLAKRLNLQDQHARLLAHPRLGLGVKRRDAYSEYPTPSYRAVQAVMDGETRSEELRLLYVAMTRAERRLILSCDALPETPPCQTVTKGDLILHSSVAAWLLKARDPCWAVPESAQAGELIRSDAPKQAENGAAVSRFALETEWRYPYPEAVDTPSKMTATGLKGRFPDEQVRENAAEAFVSTRPAPLATSPFRKGSATLTPAERGTAVHLFLQFCDFSAASGPGGAEAEVFRLREMALLTPEQADAVDPQVIRRFFSSPRGKTVITAERLRREQKFSLLIGSGDIPGLALPEGEKVLLQGVVDCYYETAEGLVVLDFKTDRVAPGGEAERAQLYKPQMDAYAAALTAMTGCPVAERVLVFMMTGGEVVV